MKAILIGRHKLSGQEGLEVVAQENINFPAQSGHCQDILLSLFEQARQEDAVLVFQMMPGQVAVGLHGLLGNANDPRIGVIVNRPGERLAGVIREFEDSEDLVEVIKFCNPRAKIERGRGRIKIEVDPPLRFEFSHIEWFN